MGSKYVAVKYTFRKANGNLDQRIIHLLMTEHCDSIIDCSYDGKRINNEDKENGILSGTE